MGNKRLFARSAFRSAALLAALVLAACGGNAELGGDGTGGTLGGTAGGTTVGGTTNPSVATVTILASATELDSSASSSGGITLTALVRDANNLIISGASVVWAADSGALAVSGAQATLTTGGDPSTRQIKVQAVSGGKSGSVAINVVPSPQPPVYRLGVLNGTTFQTGKIDVVTANLGAGGSTGLRVNVVDVSNGNQLVNEPVTVSFNSPCTSGGLSEVQLGTPGLGTTNATYRAKGCSGSDVITASALAPNGAALSASGTVTVAPDSTGAIEFLSASRSMIGIAGTGVPENSQLVFKVVNNSGGPVQNAPVAFALTVVTGALGVKLSSASGTTASDGTVSVTVISGSAPGTVRVLATSDQKSAQSSALVVTTGLTVEDHYSVAAECFNVEAWSRDNVQVPITVRMGDRYSNWPPPGTAAYFKTDGGTIGAANEEGACLTGALDSADTAGTCSVVWRSQNPRPIDGRVTVTGSSQGEDGSGTIGNPIELVQTVTLIMSGSSPVIVPADIVIDGGTLVGDVITVTKGAVATLRIIVRDARDQPMPQGTTIALSVNDAGATTGTSSWTVPCMTEVDDDSNRYLFRIKASDTVGEGSVELKVAVPSGLESVYSYKLVITN